MKRSPLPLPPRWRWILWPVVALCGGGTAITVWLQEEPMVLAAELCAPMAGLAGLGVGLYWFNHLVFKATRPRREDLAKPSPRETRTKGH